MVSQGGPTKRCKLGHLFSSWSELVSVADFFIGNGRIRHHGTRETYIHSLPSELSYTPGINLVFYFRASGEQLAFSLAKCHKYCSFSNFEL